jgi:citrate synthase
MDGRITAAEAAARLGIKRETLYAYVSRGLLDSHAGPDGKSSTFDPSEVDALHTRRNKPKAGRLDATILSSITEIANQRVLVRGHDLAELAMRGVAFESVASLLWTGELTDHTPWSRNAPLAKATLLAQRSMPDGAPLIDRLRLCVALASACDDMRHDLQPRGVVRTAPALIAAMVDGLPHERANPDGSIAERLWPALTMQRPSARWIAALNGALVLLADHDLAASTFAARVAASTRADPYSVVCAGLGAFGGPLHGAASMHAFRLLVAAHRGRASAAVGEMLGAGGAVPGFGHLLYTYADPRGQALFELVRAAGPAPSRLATCDEVLDLVRSRTGVEPNVDFAIASFAFLTGMPDDAGEAIFGVARTAGWIAHALEEYREAPLRFRPVARYIGPR